MTQVNGIKKMGKNPSSTLDIGSHINVKRQLLPEAGAERIL
jgi:hypothetical protein